MSFSREMCAPAPVYPSLSLSVTWNQIFTRCLIGEKPSDLRVEKFGMLSFRPLVYEELRVERTQESRKFCSFIKHREAKFCDLIGQKVLNLYIFFFFFCWKNSLPHPELFKELFQHHLSGLSTVVFRLQSVRKLWPAVHTPLFPFFHTGDRFAGRLPLV